MQSDVSDAGTRLKTTRVKKRKKESTKHEVRNNVNESFWTDLVAEESITETTVEPANDVKLLSQTVQPDNLVLRKLLRGPRYFDPPDECWGNCYNCGEGGHRTVDCVVEKKNKPCFLCGSTEHTFKKCKKERKCSTCKRKGHRAKDCPETNLKNGSTTDKICLKCGDCGHDMFSCKNSYFPMDLKALRCYICEGFGHLCCYTSMDHVSIELSCYKCGGRGHTGLACKRLAGETAGLSSPTLCYNCFHGGHFARECPLKGHSKLNGDITGTNISSLRSNGGVENHFARKCPNPSMDSKCSDHDKSRPNWKLLSDEDGAATCNEPSRVGRITEDLRVSPVPCKKETPSKKRVSFDDLSKSPPSYRKATNKNRKRSQSTPLSWKHQINSPHSSKASKRRNNNSVQPRDLDSQGSTRSSNYQSYPPSRFFSYCNNSK